ncbi:MAG: transporter [Burkholderiales bacterium]|jgi:DHA2 family methylenomycin A resistance protein-like MFS transporter|nr:transporter [Burkholderiales bacterium]
MYNYKPLIALCFGYFMVIIDVTVVNVAIAALSLDMHIGLSNLEWVVDAYTLTFSALLLSTGYFSDRYGAHKIFQLGLVIFTLASFLCGIAPTFLFLLIARLLQGFGAALLVPTSLSLINFSYSNKVELTKAVGIWAAVAGIAAAFGPILGAFITTIFSWRGIFFINIPFGIVCFILTNKWVARPSPHSDRAKFDTLGQVFSILSIAALSYALIEVSNKHLLLLAYCLFICSFVGFIFTEYFTKSPMLPLKLFHSKGFNISILVGFLLNMGFYGQLFLLPMYFQHIKSYPILLSGLAISPLMFFVPLGSFLSGKVMNYLSIRYTIFIGFAISTLGLLGIFIVIKYNLNYIFFITPLLFIGFGTSFIMPAATVASIKSVAPTETGIASGTLNTMRQLGSLVGVALFGTITAISTSFDQGVQYAVIGAIITFIIGIILSFL